MVVWRRLYQRMLHFMETLTDDDDDDDNGDNDGDNSKQ
jgi:hypothetical protein